MNANATADEALAEAPSSGGWLNLRSERLLWGLAAVIVAATVAISLFRGIPQLISLETTINDQLRVLIDQLLEEQAAVATN